MIFSFLLLNLLTFLDVIALNVLFDYYLVERLYFEMLCEAEIRSIFWNFELFLL